MTNLNFDLALEALTSSPGHYRAHVLVSPAGEASTEFVLPFSKVELENYILKMGHTRRGVRGSSTPEGKIAQEFGGKLYDAIMQGMVRDCLRNSLDIVSQQPEQGLRLRLRLIDAPVLADLPWEYLYDTVSRRFFTQSATTPIVRYLGLPQPIQPLAVQPPLKILVMVANPRDYTPLDVEAEWRNVQDALGDLIQRGLVTLTRLESATLTALQRQMRREHYHILHFIGHGRFDLQTQEGVLVLENEAGLTWLMSSSNLGALLRDYRSLRLVVLNTCEGARTSQNDPFAGVAQTLLQQGIPAVIAIQFEITDRAATTFAQAFYSALADTYPVDGALAEARKTILFTGNDVEWGTPVLYLRSPNGNIFELAKFRPAPPIFPSPVEPVLAKSPTSQSIFRRRSSLFWIVPLFAALVISSVIGGRQLFTFLGPLMSRMSMLAPISVTSTPAATTTPTATIPQPTVTVTTKATAKIALAPTAASQSTATPTASPVPTTTLRPTATDTPVPALTPTVTLVSDPNQLEGRGQRTED